jgi:hypothetical protein
MGEPDHSMAESVKGFLVACSSLSCSRESPAQEGARFCKKGRRGY